MTEIKLITTNDEDLKAKYTELRIMLFNGFIISILFEISLRITDLFRIGIGGNFFKEKRYFAISFENYLSLFSLAFFISYDSDFFSEKEIEEISLKSEDIIKELSE
jgi:hypothetical protein